MDDDDDDDDDGSSSSDSEEEELDDDEDEDDDDGYDELAAPLLERLLASPRTVWLSPAERAAEEERVLGVLRPLLVARHKNAATYDSAGMRFGQLLLGNYLALLLRRASPERADPAGDLATLAFCLRCLHELHEPWRLRFAATVDVGATLNALLEDADPDAYVDALVDKCLRAFQEGAEPRDGFYEDVNQMETDIRQGKDDPPVVGRTLAHTQFVRQKCLTKLAHLSQATAQHVAEIRRLRELNLPAAVDEIGVTVFDPEWLRNREQLPQADLLDLHEAITRWLGAARLKESHQALERLEALAARAEGLVPHMAGDADDNAESRFQLSALALLARDLALPIREAIFPDRALAVGLGTHSRTGGASWLRQLEPGLVRDIAEKAWLLR